MLWRNQYVTRFVQDVKCKSQCLYMCHVLGLYCNTIVSGFRSIFICKYWNYSVTTEPAAVGFTSPDIVLLHLAPEQGQQWHLVSIGKTREPRPVERREDPDPDEKFDRSLNRWLVLICTHMVQSDVSTIYKTLIDRKY
jgi:hypothetical protein